MLHFTENEKVVFSSDFHYSHRNIIRGLSTWGDPTSCRPFDSIIGMNLWLVERINETVGQDGTLIFLGDWSFGHPHEILALRDQIWTRNIHLVLGNHDKHIKYNKNIQTNHGIIKPHDLFTSIQDILRVTIGTQTIFLSHYGHRVWPDSHHGSWHLYGHSHGSLPSHGKSMDVGIDTGGPYTFEEIRRFMNGQEIVKADYHGISS